MSEFTPESISERLKWRYACKRFSTDRKISDDVWSAIEQSLVLTPSSFGLQPWKFVVVTSQEVKDQLPPVSWHQTQPRECSHMVVLAARTNMDEAYVDRFFDSIVETRGVPKDSLAGYRNIVLGSIKRPVDQIVVWNTRQVYIALGQLMATAAMLGVDACPMEGIDPAGYDKLLGLAGTDYATVVACALGYRHPEDKYATVPKVRFAAADIVEYR